MSCSNLSTTSPHVRGILALNSRPAKFSSGGTCEVFAGFLAVSLTVRGAIWFLSWFFRDGNRATLPRRGLASGIKPAIGRSDRSNGKSEKPHGAEGGGQCRTPNEPRGRTRKGSEPATARRTAKPNDGAGDAGWVGVFLKTREATQRRSRSDAKHRRRPLRSRRAAKPPFLVRPRE